MMVDLIHDDRDSAPKEEKKKQPITNLEQVKDRLYEAFTVASNNAAAHFSDSAQKAMAIMSSLGLTIAAVEAELRERETVRPRLLADKPLKKQ